LASDWQRLGRRCVGGADGDLLGAVLYGALGLESADMSYIIASLPPIKCFVKREFLYNFTKGHGEFEPAIWVSLKALRGQVFRIESLLPAYGALYDKLPIHAYVWHPEAGDLPIDTLQLWDCMGYRFTIVEKIGLRNLGVKF
jgi:hypothetical protein